MVDYAPFPLIDLSGSPHARGVQHGKAAPDRIKRGIEMYAESLLASGVDWKELERRAQAMVPIHHPEIPGAAADQGDGFSPQIVATLLW